MIANPFFIPKNCICLSITYQSICVCCQPRCTCCQSFIASSCQTVCGNIAGVYCQVYWSTMLIFPNELTWSAELFHCTGCCSHFTSSDKNFGLQLHFLSQCNSLLVGRNRFQISHDLFYRAQRYGMTYKIFVFHKAIIVTAHPMGVKVNLLIPWSYTSVRVMRITEGLIVRVSGSFARWPPKSRWAL